MTALAHLVLAGRTVTLMQHAPADFELLRDGEPEGRFMRADLGMAAFGRACDALAVAARTAT